jgi:hypothetical protein
MGQNSYSKAHRVRIPLVRARSSWTLRFRRTEAHAREAEEAIASLGIPANRVPADAKLG